MAITGMELRLKRTAADVRPSEVAEAMGVTPSRVSHIERLRIVTDEAASKYLRALDTCITKSNTDAPEAA